MSSGHRPTHAISIAMGTYNGAPYLAEQLESLLNQQLAPFELVVGDDSSTDDTLAILNEFSTRAPFPVHVTSNSKQLGYGENFLQAASRCTGDWVAFCDQDDFWLRSKLTRCAEAIASGPADLGLVVHSAILGDRDLAQIGRLDTPAAGLYPRLTLPPDWVCQGFRQVIRRSLLIDLPFDDRSMAWHAYPDAHDTWACLIASVTGPVLVLDDPLVIYRRHGGNATEGDGLAPVSLAERARATVRDNSKHYAEISVMYRTIADYLEDRANGRLAPERRDQLRSASTRIADYADRLAARARVNHKTPLARRVGAFASIARSGAYLPGATWGFGMSGAIKDLVRVVFPGVGASKE